MCLSVMLTNIWNECCRVTVGGGRVRVIDSESDWQRECEWVWQWVTARVRVRPSQWQLFVDP